MNAVANDNLKYNLAPNCGNGNDRFDKLRRHTVQRSASERQGSRAGNLYLPRWHPIRGRV